MSIARLHPGHRPRTLRAARTALTAFTAVALLSSCAAPVTEERDLPPVIEEHAGPPLPPDSSIEEPGAVAPVDLDADGWPGSLAPDDRPREERVPKIIERGRLIVGVDQSQNLLSFRDPVSGQLRGFEVDLAKEIARDIFDDPERVDFRFVDSGDRLRSLASGDVDLVIRSMSITRDRASRAEFSTPYFRTQTRLLTMESSGINSIGDLPGHTICVADGSTALQKARTVAPESSILRTLTWSDCLMALQQHQAQVILGDDAILSGIAAQDPYTRILGTTLDTEYYSVAIARSQGNRDTSGLVRQVNSTIERIRDDATWWSMFNDWFGSYLWTFGPPELRYRPETEAETETVSEAATAAGSPGNREAGTPDEPTPGS